MNRPHVVSLVGSAVRTVLPILRFFSWSAHRPLRALRAGASVVLAVTLLMTLTGCQLIVDPFTDGLASQPPVATPSVEGVRMAQARTATDLRRSHEEMRVEGEERTVTHGPLYFADPLEGGGSDDGKFAWTGKDYLLFFHGQAQFVLNGILLPVSAVIAPPWTVMHSDSEPRWISLGCVPLVRIDGERSSGI